MQTLKKVICVITVVVLIFALSAPCFAAAATLSAAEQMVALWAMYTESVGIDSVYTNNGFKTSFSNPFSRSTAASNISDLYNQYCTYSGRIQTISETVDWIKANTEIAVSVQQKGAFEYSAGVSEFFDKFTSWVLETVVGLQKNVNGLFDSSAPWFNNQLYYDSTDANFIVCPIINANPTYNQLVANGIYLGGNYWNYNLFAAAGEEPVYMALTKSGSAATLYIRVYFSQAPFTAYEATQNGNGQETVGSYAGTLQQAGYYYARVSSYGIDVDSVPAGIPIYPVVSDAITAYENGVTDASQERIQLGPKDIYNDGVIGIPDVDAEDYVAQPTTGELDQPAVNSIDDALPGVLDRVLTNTHALTDTLAQGITAVSPFVPFGAIPSFSFGFSGIWHYVVSWVNSLGSGLGFFSSIWSNIPYAMVVPIYAAAVVVIVTSIFKRFV